jgi:hypothetical protein
LHIFRKNTRGYEKLFRNPPRLFVKTGCRGFKGVEHLHLYTLAKTLDFSFSCVSHKKCDCGDKIFLKIKDKIALVLKIKIANGVPNKFDAPDDDISFLWSCLNRTVSDQRRGIARQFAFQKEKLLHQINIPHHRKDCDQV